MAKDGTFTVLCPECDTEILIDAATGQVMRHRKPKDPLAGGHDFDELLADLDHQKARAEALFDQEVAALKDKDRILEEKFQRALKEAKDSPDDGPPRRPFDLD